MRTCYGWSRRNSTSLLFDLALLVHKAFCEKSEYFLNKICWSLVLSNDFQFVGCAITAIMHLRAVAESHYWPNLSFGYRSSVSYSLFHWLRAGWEPRIFNHTPTSIPRIIFFSAKSWPWPSGPREVTIRLPYSYINRNYFLGLFGGKARFVRCYIFGHRSLYAHPTRCSVITKLITVHW